MTHPAWPPQDRAHRIGQRNNVLVKYLVGLDTMEEDMWSMIAKKFDTISRLLDNDVKKDGLGATVVPTETSSAPDPKRRRIGGPGRANGV